MSRYRATTGELLEQIRQEGKMKDIYNMAFAGDKADTIAKKLKLDVETVKKVLGERFSMSDFKSNEKDNSNNYHALSRLDLKVLLREIKESFDHFLNKNNCPI